MDNNIGFSQTSYTTPDSIYQVAKNLNDKINTYGNSNLYGYKISRISSMRDIDIDQINIDDSKKMELKVARDTYNNLKSLLTQIKERKITYIDMSYDINGRVQEIKYELK